MTKEEYEELEAKTREYRQLEEAEEKAKRVLECSEADKVYTLSVYNFVNMGESCDISFSKPEFIDLVNHELALIKERKESL